MGGGGVNVIEREGHYDVENTVFVAVGKDVKESKANLKWASQSFVGRNFCILHVHHPNSFLTLMNENASGSKLKQQAIKAYREIERQKLHKLLNQYLLILAQVGVEAGKVWIEMDNIEKGIVQIIAQHGIRCLVMGAAADKHYSKKMLELKSSKAMFVCQQAPISCHIWFACKGYLIYTRTINGSSHAGSIVSTSPTSTSKITSPQSQAADKDDEDDEDDDSFQCLEFSTRSMDKVDGTINPNPLLMDNEIIGDGSQLSSPHKFRDHLLHSSSIILPEERSEGQTTRDIYDKMEQRMIEGEISKRKRFEKSVRRRKAEEDAVEALREAEASESSLMKEINQRREMEEMLDRQRQESERLKNQHDQCIKELQLVRDQIPVLEAQITDSRHVEEELEVKIIQAVKLLVTFKEKRDELQIECDKANREINKQRILVVDDAIDLCRPESFAFSFLEIVEATRNFDPSWKIGEGRCGSVYKGILRHVKVAIKMLPCSGSQGNLEFEDEVGMLSRARHPNLVILIGTCPESKSLIYEYLESGSLEDRLDCRGKTPPLPWKTRIKIAIEICCALIFLHSNNPRIFHGNLKPTNILLDANFVSKLCDFGIYRLIPHDEHPVYTPNMDPETLETGELTAESDVYSFGIVMLRMLTGRPAIGIVNDVKCALEKGYFDMVLDISGGDWPLEQAKQLAHLALRCCEKNRMSRPNLVSDIWTVIEPMRDMCTQMSSDSEGHRRIPSHFVCPIFQEVMEDPYIAADGFTYEADAIKGWFNSGHKTSPMTNLKLDNCDLLPNYALYYAIQEWMKQS